MRAIIVTIGDELIIGHVLNSNAAWLGEQLVLSGLDVLRTVTVGDDVALLSMELGRALAEADLVIATGGLGPTHDDVTREAVAALYDVDLNYHAEIYERIIDRFRGRAGRMPESNRKQAMVPAGFTVLRNEAGTAPGLWHDGEKFGMLAVLPGVPHEMKRLFLEEVRPRVLGRGGLRAVAHRTLRTAGIGESSLQDAIGDLSDVLSESLRLAYLPDTSGVRLRISAFGIGQEEVTVKLRDLEERLRRRIARHIYGAGDETIEEVVGRMLKERSLTIAVAESCTGGHVSHAITNVSGSSSYMLGGIVAYSNGVKTQLLGVDPDVLDDSGAVSEGVARQMADGVRARLGADIGISTTGVAGPTGGTQDKPVGTVWIGYSDARGVETRLLRLVQDRRINKELTTTLLLDHVRRNLLSNRL